jgi:hypothetical protein
VDDARFDSLTRALAAGFSRRQGLRALAGAGAALLPLARSAGRGASAHHAMLGPGDPCFESSQCLAADAPLICADNGFALDGPLNCYTDVWRRCGFDQGCCGDAACIDGFCGNIQDFPGSGERCRDSSVCVGADAPLTCDFVAITGDYRSAPMREVVAGPTRPAAGRQPVSVAIAPTSTSMAVWTLRAREIPARTARNVSRPTQPSPATISASLTTIAAVRSRAVAVAGMADAAGGCAVATMASAPARPQPVATAKDASATSTIQTRALLAWSAARCKADSSAPPGPIAEGDASAPG